MALTFKLKDLAETILDFIRCPHCEHGAQDDEFFSTDLTRVTLEGIVVVCECKLCGEIFVPELQKRDVEDPQQLELAIQNDKEKHGVEFFPGLEEVKLRAEQMNAIKKNQLH